MAKRISDWIREFIDNEDLYPRHIAELRRIANRIDSEMVELPKGKDGRPIHVGETVYGEDGKAWHVRGVVLCSASVTERRFSVKAIGDSGQWRGLKPEWLTHERHDSFERIADELEGLSVDSMISDTNLLSSCALDLAKRIRRLAAKEDLR